MFEGDDIIVRFLRVRRGVGRTGNAGECCGDNVNFNGNNTMLDHLSLSFSTDENLASGIASNFTVQNSLIYEGLFLASHTYTLDNTHPSYQGGHSKGALVGRNGTESATNGTFYKIAFVNNDGRNPQIISPGKFEIVNCLGVNNAFFNLGTFSGDRAPGGQFNIVKNLVIPGLDTRDRYEITLSDNDFTEVYVQGNIGTKRTSESQDEWAGVGRMSNPIDKSTQTLNRFSTLLSDRYSDLPDANELDSQEIVEKLGAYLYRDQLDVRIHNEILTGGSTSPKTYEDLSYFSPNDWGTGSRTYYNLKNSVAEAGGYPTISNMSSNIVDSNISGIEDSFSSIHNLSGDGNNITANWDFGDFRVINNAGYSDKEIYLAWLANDFDGLERTFIQDSLDINGALKQITSYSSQDFGGNYTISDNGSVLELIGNSWKKAALDYTITPNTILEFDFRVDGEGEIQGIGFDDNTSLNTSGSDDEFFFKLAGFQGVGWDNSDFENYSIGDGWKSYSIPLGEYFTGDKNFLVFMGDRDNSPEIQNSSFRNITFRETSQVGADQVWLEAECATVGQNWSTVQDSSSSQGAYLLPPSGANYNTPPSSQDDFVSFDFEIEAGEYGVFALVNTPNPEDDSFWVRANGGNWIKWNNLSNSEGLKWREVYDSDNEDAIVTFNLSNGANTIDFAHREDGAALDKILIRAIGTAPSGNGNIASNCATVVSQTLSLSPTDDAYLQGSTRFNNDLLKVSPTSRVTYFKFDLSAISGSIVEAQLKFTVTQDTGNGDIKVYKGNSTNWTETNLSTANRPTEGSQ